MLKVGDFVVIKNKYIKKVVSYQKSGIYIITGTSDSFIAMEDYYEHFFPFNKGERPVSIEAWKYQVKKINFGQRKLTCDVCNKEKYEYELYSYKGKHVCSNCLKVKPYSTKNNKKILINDDSQKRFGIEFECIPKDENSYVEIVSSNPCIIPTSDGSLPTGGVEFKTPIIDSLNIIEIFLSSIESNAILTDDSCGQHINISDSRIDDAGYYAIRMSSDEIFNRLLKYLIFHPFSTKRIWGRYFTDYADCNNYYRHGSWLNLNKSNVIEWRLPKYRNHKQYMNLLNIISGIDDIIYKEYISPFYDDNYFHMEQVNKLATKCSKNIVKFYKSCVRKERINRFISLFRT